jgi:hypothetical protein
MGIEEVAANSSWCSSGAYVLSNRSNEMRADWWKYPDYFLYLVMDTGPAKEVHREDIESEVLEAILTEGQKLFGDDVALPIPGDYWLNLTFDAGFASFTICKGSCEKGRALLHGYFSSEYDDWDLAWQCVEEHYLRLTDLSAIDWPLAEKPKPRPWLAVIRYRGDLRCDCEVCKELREKAPDASIEHLQAELGEIAKAIGLLLLKEGFPKELYEDS